jgi:hypothetical protein
MTQTQTPPADTTFEGLFDLALDQAARDLNAGTADLDQLTLKTLDAVRPAERAEALVLLIKEHIGMWIAVNCLLDECEPGTYDVEREVTVSLAEAVIAQNRVPCALRELTGERIQHRARMLTALASAG